MLLTTKLSGYKNFLLFILLLAGAINLSAQSSGKITLFYRRDISENGLPEARVFLSYKVVNTFGMISVLLSAECNSATYNGYYYKGRHFQNVNTDNVKVKNPTVKFLAKGPDGISKVITYNVTTGMGGGVLENSTSIIMDAKTAAQKDPANYSLSEFSVLSVSLDNTSSVVNACESMMKTEKYDDMIKQGDAAFNSKNWEEAKNQYKKAWYLIPDKTYPKDQLDKIKTEESNLKEEANKKAKVEGLIKKGDNSAAAGNFTQAQGFYKEAIDLDPSNSTAKGKLADAEKNQKAKEVKPTGKEAEKATADAGKKTGEGDKKTNSDGKKSSSSGSSNEASEEDSEARKKADADAAAEAERARLKEQAEKAEKERASREKDYYDTKNQQTSDNEKTATELLIQALMLHFFIAKQIYQDVGTDNYFSQYKGDSYLLRAKAGYGLTAAPIFFNSSIESYDGNNYSYKTSTVDRQVVSLDLGAGAEFWPLYGKRNGLGIFANIGAGHGFTFQNFILFGNGGLQAYSGTEKIKLFGEYSFGYRGITKNSWIDERESGTGDAKFSYQRIKIGPRVTFDFDWDGPTRGTFDLLPIFELPSYRRSHYFSPVNMQWLNGIGLNIGFDNRLSLNLEYFWRYQRAGVVEYAYGSSTSFSGSFFKFSVVRNFDFFGDSPLTINKEKLDNFKDKKAFKGIMFFNASFGYNQGKDLYVTKPNLGLRLGYEHDINLFKNTNIATGIGFALNNGGWSTTNTADTMKTGYHSIFIPTTIRSYLNDYTPQKYWIKYGINHHIAAGKNVIGKSFSERYIKSYIPCLSVGLGLDYKMGESAAFRTGVSFERSLTPYYEAPKQAIKSNQISLHLGVIF